MQYTADELKKLPTNILRGIDIKNADEEKLVQLILNERTVAEGKAPIPFVTTSAMTDAIKTKEQEKELQIKIDEHNRAQLVAVGAEDEDEDEEDDTDEDELELKGEPCIHCKQSNGHHLDGCASLIK